jgi:hypothetical protein
LEVKPSEFCHLRQLARSLLIHEQPPLRRLFKKVQAMITRLIQPRTTLDKAIALSFASMLAMNVFVLSQQLTAAPTVAITDGPVAAQQA